MDEEGCGGLGNAMESHGVNVIEGVYFEKVFGCVHFLFVSSTNNEQVATVIKYSVVNYTSKLILF